MHTERLSAVKRFQAALLVGTLAAAELVAEDAAWSWSRPAPLPPPLPPRPLPLLGWSDEEYGSAPLRLLRR